MIIIRLLISSKKIFTHSDIVITWLSKVLISIVIKANYNKSMSGIDNVKQKIV